MKKKLKKLKMKKKSQSFFSKCFKQQVKLKYQWSSECSAAVSQITPGSWDTQRSASSVDVYSKNFTDGNFGIILMFWEVWYLTLFQNLN